jgi:mannose-6-phosphate isomerase-like protein (cupin superfamily)
MHYKVLAFDNEFSLAFGNASAQAAEMVIAPGQSEGGPQNRHRGADQWLFVLSGAGEATVEGRILPLSPGALLLIERGERHELRNTGERPLQTLNLYTPPAFAGDGMPLGPGKD